MHRLRQIEQEMYSFGTLWRSVIHFAVCAILPCFQWFVVLEMCKLLFDRISFVCDKLFHLDCDGMWKKNGKEDFFWSYIFLPYFNFIDLHLEILNRESIKILLYRKLGHFSSLSDNNNACALVVYMCFSYTFFGVSCCLFVG